VMLWDATTGVSSAITKSEGHSFLVDTTPDARHMLISSDADNLVPGVQLPTSAIFAWDAGPD
jgi:hypothetical protein